ncbi:E3 ubiquitin-protein ligase RBBP6 [Drosophila obscura]|uniref:E3 ubiquitin-protein ligase RBBP6 n=1 Tax=Drosophila obscura TaxID=7282 RepID=UPI001BB18831|nr:E3 ubiquitin-protein ligase RBBP6 [Drosophila obscura]
MSVHYKFKSTLNFDTITFDGLHISVGDLKREIVQQKRLGKIIDFDLQITNAQTKEEYKDDGVLIPKNTTLIISRIPLAHPTKKGWEPPAENAAPVPSSNKQESFNIDLSKMQGTEEDKIHAMMMQSTVDYDPKTYHRIKGQSQVGEVPASYRCNKCKKTGHWIKNCPYTAGKDQFEVKRNTGIPRSFRDKTDTATEEEAAMFVMPAEQSQEIPEDLICGICRDIFVDAVMIPCCGSSFCDDCVRNSLLESEESECPDCKEKNCSPGSLIPNRFLRNSVNAFKNETGYTMRAAKSVAVKKVEKPIEEKPPGSEEKPIEEKPKIEEKPLVENPVAEKEPEEVASKEKTLKQEEPETNGKKHPPKVPSPEPAEAKATATATDSNADQSQKEKEKEKEKDKYDSDYEDNITITMPQTLSDSASIVSSKLSPTFPRKPPAHHVSHRREHKMDYMSESDMKRRPPTQSQSDSGKPHNERERGERSLLPTPISTHQSYQGHHVVNESDEVHRGNVYKPPYMQMPRGPPPLHMMGHHIPPPYSNGYNNMGQRPPLSFVPYQNQPVHPIRAQYGPSGGNMNMNMSQQFQSPNLASIYQGVAAKVGSGLIDDPLEAFNRIMKEKERQKSERFRSIDHHRSRSPDRQRSHRFKSPVYEKESLRDLNLKDKRPRSRERKREYSYERHTRHNRPSRQPCDGSKSPINKIKRSAPRRSISPKPSYKSDFRDKSYAKPSAPKLDPIEPPPPGFEGMQLFDDAAAYKTKHHLGGSGGHSKRSVAEDEVPRKRQRSRSRSKEPHQKLIDTSFRSLTPPPAKVAVTAARQPTVGPSYDHGERSPKTPERGQEEYSMQPIQRVIQNAAEEATAGNLLDSMGNIGKENKSKSPVPLKERKKKKKDKTERKKNKKDKKGKKEKEKHERAKKSSSINRSDSDINHMQIEQTCKITPPLRAMAESYDKYESASNSPAQSRSHEVVKPIKALFAVEAPHKHSFGDESVGVSARSAKRSDATAVNAVNLSKWELEENSLSCNFDDPFKRSGSANSGGEHSEITSDVIRKAENAIFAKAINAIRPVEFQVVINSKGNSKDRSVSIRNDNKDRSLSPKQRPSSKSVKERLGNKVVRERSRSEDKSRGGKRREILAKVAADDDGYRGRADARSGSRRRDKQSRDRDRAISTEKRHSQQVYKRTLPESDRQRRPYKDAKHDKFDQINIHDSDRRGVRNVKSGEGRIVSSVSVAAMPPKPCRPDNPFRRAGDSSSSNNLVLKYDNTIQNDVSHPASSRSAPESSFEQRKQKDKKLKKHAKYSSTDSLKSEKRKELKSKRKSKIMKKKKKSKK